MRPISYNSNAYFFSPEPTSCTCPKPGQSSPRPIL
jgi:hypothetical protein